MPSPDRLAAGIEVVGRLSILADDAPLDIEFRGGAIEVALPDLRTALALRTRFSRAERRAWTRSVQSLLAHTGLELRFRVSRHQIGRLSATSRRGRLSAWLGVDPLELNLGAIASALFGRDSPAPAGGRGVDPGPEKE